MITIPLYILLFIYLLFLVVFTVFFVISLYHIIGTGMFSKPGLFTTFFVFLIIILVLYMTFVLLSEVDWRQPIIDFSKLYI